jgi:ribonuclease-3
VTHAIEEGLVAVHDENHKSLLLEFAQSHGMGVPRYVIIHEEGPDHDRTFTVEVVINNHQSGTGVGKNKKEAEQDAAREALDILMKEDHPAD